MKVSKITFSFICDILYLFPCIQDGVSLILSLYFYLDLTLNDTSYQIRPNHYSNHSRGGIVSFAIHTFVFLSQKQYSRLHTRGTRFYKKCFRICKKMNTDRMSIQRRSRVTLQVYLQAQSLSKLYLWSRSRVTYTICYSMRKKQLRQDRDVSN